MTCELELCCWWQDLKQGTQDLKIALLGHPTLKVLLSTDHKTSLERCANERDMMMLHKDLEEFSDTVAGLEKLLAKLKAMHDVVAS